MTAPTGFADPAEIPETAIRASLSPVRRAYCLILLMLVYTMSMLDRQIMTILIEPIRAELKLSDTVMGLLTGTAFALVYVTLCIPAARFADRWSRRKMVALAIAGWSLMTILCGSATNVMQLFAARFGVGVGEACGSPATQALVGDLFSRRRRGTAMAVLMLSAPLGMGAGLALGGWALAAYGWRTAFILAGLPGFVLALLVFVSFPEVRKGMADGVVKPRAAEPLWTTLRALWSTRSFPYMIIGASFLTLISMGLLSWVPAFFIRSHGMGTVEVGTKLGAALGVGSLIGHLAGGPLMDFLGKRDLRWHLWLPTVAAPLSGMLAAAALLAPANLAFPLLGAQLLLASLFTAPLIAITMNLAPVSSRATAGAVLGFILNAVGLGFGPQMVGIASDILAPALGADSLRVAMLAVTPLGLVAGMLFFRASLSYRADIDTVDQRNQAGG
jgi:MFS family permease